MHLSMLLLASIALVADELPGTRFAVLRAGTVLHAGPSVDHAGVLTLDADTVVRADAPDGEFAPVYLGQGFPAYLHGDFVAVDGNQRRVRVTGSRVNLRLLPASAGLPPVGKVDEGAELVLLDEESGWVRVLAPASVALHVRASELAPPTASSEAGWAAAVARREARRQRDLTAFRATDPSWQAAERQAAEIDALESLAVDSLDDAGLVARRQALTEMAGRIERPAERARLQRLIDETTVELDSRQAAVQRLEALADEQARESENIVREARALGMGLRFLGRGDALVVEGIVARRASEENEAVVYSIRDGFGRVYKLSAAPEIAELSALIGRKVVLEGRTLPLVSVEGPVLIVDRVAAVHPR